MKQRNLVRDTATKYVSCQGQYRKKTKKHAYENDESMQRVCYEYAKGMLRVYEGYGKSMRMDGKSMLRVC